MEGSFNAFEAMGAQLRTWIEANTQSQRVAEGEFLIKEGSREARLWVIEAGAGQVSTTGPDGLPIPLADLGAGALIGEMSVLEKRPAVASVVAGASCRAISLDPPALEAAMAKDPRLARDVNSLFAHKLATQLAAQNSFVHRWHNTPVEPLRKALVVFAHLSEIDVEWLTRIGQHHHHVNGSTLIQQGELIPDLLLVLSGTASVRVDSTAGPVEVGTSRAGELLGEMSLVGGNARASATVIAASPMEVLTLPKDLLLHRLEEDPALGARFFRGMALLLSQRNRDQLLSHGLAAASLQAESAQATGATSLDPGNSPSAAELEGEEILDLQQMGSISLAGQRFHWLCQNLRLPEGS